MHEYRYYDIRIRSVIYLFVTHKGFYLRMLWYI